MIALVPEKLEALRTRVGLSVKAAARAAKLNYKTIEALEGRAEDGKGPPEKPKLETVLALARTYGCTPREFAENPADWDTYVAGLGITLVTPLPPPATPPQRGRPRTRVLTTSEGGR